MAQKTDQTLQVTLSGAGVLRVELNRPQVRNAFNGRMIQELTEVFSERLRDPQVKVTVLCGAGASFCAGGDLNWMRESVELSREQNLQDTRELAHLFSIINECPRPLIGLVHGAVLGGGVGLVSVCDVVVASRETQFSLSEVRLGIIPACIGPFVVAKIGASHSRALFISAERFSAERALAIGLIHEVVERPEELQKSFELKLEALLQCGPQAVAAAKRLVLDLSWPERRAQFPDPLEYVAKILADLRVSPEGQEGVRAFLEKRKPSWLSK